MEKTDEATKKLVDALWLLIQCVQMEQEVETVRMLVNDIPILEMDAEGFRKTLASTDGSPSKPLVSLPEITVDPIENPPKESSQKSLKERFERLVAQSPIIAGYYQPGPDTVNLTKIQHRFFTTSQRERVLVAFLKVVFDRQGKWGYGIEEFPLLNHLDELWSEDLKLISEWVADPFYLMTKQGERDD